MLHRAVLGSLERFIAIYIEHTGGDFPFWLSPVQVGILPISEKQLAYGAELKQKLQSVGLRVALDERSETLGFKIREAEKQKIPLTLVVGEKEVATGTVSPRLRKSKSKIEAMSTDAIAGELAAAVVERRMGPLE
jgi:threonyl-tRNA synthetase